MLLERGTNLFVVWIGLEFESTLNSKKLAIKLNEIQSSIFMEGNKVYIYNYSFSLIDKKISL